MGKRIYLLPEEGTFYKANLHCHTTISDGHLTPEECKNMYQEKGYSIIAFSDHRTYQYHSQLNEEEFLTIAAYEVDLNEKREDGEWGRTKTYHFNLFDTDPLKNKEQKRKSSCPEQNYSNIEQINAYIKQMSELGFLVCYNHPYWSLQQYEDYKQLEGLFAMEIFNYGSQLEGMYGYAPQVYDDMLRLGKALYCIAGDDNHNRYGIDNPQCDSFGGFTMIKSKQLDYKSIIEALKNGWFYSSMGPKIKELYIEEGELVIKCSPVEKIFVMTEGRKCYKKFAPIGETITKARFKLREKDRYIRVQCRNAKGLFVNSNAYFLNQSYFLQE